MKSLALKMIWIYGITLLFAACSNDDNMPVDEDTTPTEESVDDDGDDENDEENNGENGTDGPDPNLVTRSLRFREAQTIPGNIPNSSSAKLPNTGFKIDTDTIFWVEGIVNKIKLRKPDGFPSLIGTFFAQVPGADSHIDAKFETELENDTIVFFDFDFDVSQWDPPVSFDLNLAPKDDTGQPVVQFTIPVVIEKLNGGAGNCYMDLSGANQWEWISTWQNGQFLTAPLVFSFQESTIGGCCDVSSQTSYTAGCTLQGPDYVELTYTNTYTVNLDSFKFGSTSSGGLPGILGSLLEEATNVDASNTNFCSSTVDMAMGKNANIFDADLDIDMANCSFTLSNMVGQEEEVFAEDGTSLGFFPLPIYMGSGPMVEYQFLSPHFIKEVRSGEVTLERLYIKRTSETDDLNRFWHEVVEIVFN